MHTALAVGAGLTLLGLVAYGVGLVTAYPGRAFSLTALMTGITLLAIGRSLDAEGSA